MHFKYFFSISMKSINQEGNYASIILFQICEIETEGKHASKTKYNMTAIS